MKCPGKGDFFNNFNADAVKYSKGSFYRMMVKCDGKINNTALAQVYHYEWLRLARLANGLFSL